MLRVNSDMESLYLLCDFLVETISVRDLDAMLKNDRENYVIANYWSKVHYSRSHNKSCGNMADHEFLKCMLKDSVPSQVADHLVLLFN